MKQNTPKKGKKYSHLSLADREEIAIGKELGIPQYKIAEKIGKDPSAVSRELRRNKPLVRNVIYRANQAQKRYEERKKEGHYRERIPNKRIRKYIVRKLKKTWSPELISGRISIDLPGLRISHETIYQWIYTERRDLIQYLVQQHKKRKKRGSLKYKRLPKVPNRIMIDKRPAYIANRKTAGHWEADTAISRQSKAAIMATVERKSRYVISRKIKAKSAECMNKALIKSLKTLPRQIRKSLTYDNGTENALHEATNAVLDTSSYFCNPYHSWEKGSIENRIGIIRRFFPKKTNWALISQVELNKVISVINSRPMKCLGYKTPCEVFIALRS